MLPTVIHDVSFDHSPRQTKLSAKDARIEVYILLTQEICYDHRRQPSYRVLYDNAEKAFQSITPQKLKRGLDLKLGPLVFELCLRSLAEALPNDMDCPVGAMDIIQYLRALAGIRERNGQTTHIYSTNPVLQCRALAALTWISFRQYLWSPHPQSFELVSSCVIIKQCLSCGDHLARADFLPPIFLRFASWLSSVHIRHRKLDARRMNEESRDAQDFWKAYDVHLQNQYAREQRRLAKVAKAPNQYRCAADGCGINAMNKGALRRCGGRCPPEQKPHYCSAECQEKHWFIHRSVCRREDDGAIILDDGDPAWEDVDTYRPKLRDPDALLDTGALWATRTGAEIFIDIPNASKYRQGEVFRVRTKTMSPAFLKSYRGLWETRSVRLRKKLQRGELNGSQ
ncbi:hypothetical protein BD309DRAFT_910846 [Dichomitus squalens]|uniref:Uncharacterized protein n=1 Tax=Dichomitus squalens TaxID=114155 RepID=A0A4Q9P3V5_9APHY|nr:hypothetical protein BD309DRAFT_910846 [Dichomitus squalens]TBU64164.1 hypothetical protein BD310DRAFT_807646 [Dichomitus squalens]